MKKDSNPFGSKDSVGFGAGGMMKEDSNPFAGSSTAKDASGVSSSYEGSSTADRVSASFKASSSSPFNMMKGKQSGGSGFVKDGSPKKRQASLI